jgi:2-succinyl-5-enolpyruvyl-6-hydroxy-3-cyclohexene-1-carboxylate synthase
VHEASQARVPLIVLTADRPPELRDVGAGQTIDQLKLYGDAAKWFCELDVAQASDDRLRWIRSLACRSYWTALEGRPGPVHLNVPLREPLVLDEPLPPDTTGRADGEPWVRVDAPDPAPSFGGPHPFDHAVIVAGREEQEPETAPLLASFAARAGIPLLADPLSGARRGEAAIAHYDLLLRDPEFAAEHRPRFVFRFGDLPTSKPLRAWLAGLDGPQIGIGRAAVWQDPDSVVGLRVVSPVRALLEGAQAGVVADDSGWLRSWRAADAVAANAVAATLGDGALSEPLVAAHLGHALPPQATLFVASSMPVRDVESFFPAREDPPRVLANRGANGIDGTVSAAFGAASACDGPTALLIGDVALAHDIGGLLAARRLGLALTIVLVNNDGGGIFHFLPVAAERDAFEEHVATPHGLDFADVAAVYGLAYDRPGTVQELGSAVRKALGAPQTTIIEVRTDRAANLALHRSAADAVRARLAQG